MKDNVVLTKSYSFAIRTVKLSDHLRKKKVEFALINQVLRSGTSIGANAEEMTGATSRADFLAKAFIAYREARETHYWLRLLKDTDKLEAPLASSLLSECEELVKILGSITKSTKNSPNK